MTLPPPIDFTYLSASLESDSDLRENIKKAVRVVDSELRGCLSVCNRVHAVGREETVALLATLDPLLITLRTSLASLASLIPPTQFYRYSDSFSNSFRTASFIVVLRRFLETEELASKEEVAQALAINPEWKDHFFLPTEEYLHSLISLLNELARLAVNRTIKNDFQAPVRYAQFAKELSSAFSILNLKNDNLRKRFDSIKYDVKKLEEVVYDLSLRGLLKTGEEEGEEGQGAAKRARAA